MAYLGSSPDNDDGGFTGRLSMVQVWDRVLDFATELSEMRSISTQSNSEWPVWVTEGLVSDWDWGTYTSGPGAIKTQGTERGQELCPAGQSYDQGTSSCIGQGELLDQRPRY